MPQKLKERIQTAPLWFYNLRITSSYAQLYAIKCDSNPTDCSFAADEAMEIHPDEVHFNQAKEATADMVLREMHEHVCVGPMPVGVINITNLPMRELLE